MLPFQSGETSAIPAGVSPLEGLIHHQPKESSTMADKADSKKRAHRTDDERKADLLAQIAKIENKENEKKAKRTQYLVSSIAILDQRIAKLEAKRADLDAELSELAGGASVQPTFDSVSAEEV